MSPSPYDDLVPYRNGAADPATEPEPAAIDSGYLDDEELLERARDCFQRASEAETGWRKLAKEDMEFYAGEQWPDDIKTMRGNQRPCLTINRLPGFVHQVSNDIRQNKPAPDVSPVDDTGDIETAEIFQGIIRHIERQSKADSVRSYAAFYQVVTGRGYYRIVTDYIDPAGFDQEIFIRRIKNPQTVFFDPKCEEPDYSDARWCLIVTDMTDEQFKAEYPGHEPTGAEDFSATGASTPEWRWRGGLRVAEYFYVTRERKQIAELADGRIVPVEQAPPWVQIKRKRIVEVPRVQWAMISGAGVLERREWPGKYIPVIPVLGEEYDVDGRTEMVGMVRFAKDAQRMLNYWESAKTEMIALAPKSPFIAAEGQLENHEDEWAQANVRNFAYLYYKPKSVGNELVPPPQRQVYEPPIQAITVAQAQVVDHLKSTTGVYDASLGNRSNETSGLAIRTRQQQGDTANYHYIDNLATSITHETRILIDLIPKIYDRPGRVIRILGEDGSEQNATLNTPFQQRGNKTVLDPQQFDPRQLTKFYKLDAGRYDVAINIGPSYATKRQESADAMLQFAQAAPELTPRYADLLVEAQDWPNAQAIADRIRPPDAPPKGGEKPIPPQVQAMLQQQAQRNEELTIALNESARREESKQLECESKERMQTQELESRERIAAEQNRTQLNIKAAELGSKDAIALLNAQMAALTKRLDVLQAGVPVEATQQAPQPAAGLQQALQGPMIPQEQPERPPLESFEQPY